MVQKRKVLALSTGREPIHKARLIIRAVIHQGITARLLLDSGANCGILNNSFVRNNNIPLRKRRSPIEVRTATGDVFTGAGTAFVPETTLQIGEHKEMYAWEVGEMEEGVDGYLPIAWLHRHNPDIDWESGRLQWRSELCLKKCLSKEGERVDVREIEWSEMEEELDDPAVVAAGVISLEDDKGNNIYTKLPKAYWSYASIFSKEQINRLADHSAYDHTIDLIDGARPTFGPIYKFSEPELQALREWLDRYEANGRIEKSKSAYGAPVILVKKADGTFRVCCDFRALNKVTVKNRYPLPLIGELQERLNKAVIFSKLDLKNGYHLIRMANGHEEKTAFRTRYGLYQWKVMPEGLCNAPATFQAMMDNIFHDMLDRGVIIYLDDILIYSESLEEHSALVQKVMQRLRENNLQANLSKSLFDQEEVEFVAFLVSK